MNLLDKDIYRHGYGEAQGRQSVVCWVIGGKTEHQTLCPGGPREVARPNAVLFNESCVCSHCYEQVLDHLRQFRLLRRHRGEGCVECHRCQNWIPRG